ncbi:MAG: hypothetical protein B7Z73_15120 [Planctomycetia bacterium 21-64-5]|nr:MAG: hypothetical protein B7Z73_15120 [Planctomycetia bacterium 21-64-5]
MKFTVAWRPGAEQELARLWTGATDHVDIAAAADTIDAALAREPLAFGESRRGATRLALVAPLAAPYDVDEPNRLVTVWDLWRWQ